MGSVSFVYLYLISRRPGRESARVNVKAPAEVSLQRTPRAAGLNLPRNIAAVSSEVNADYADNVFRSSSRPVQSRVSQLQTGAGVRVRIFRWIAKSGGTDED